MDWYAESSCFLRAIASVRRVPVHDQSQRHACPWLILLRASALGLQPSSMRKFAFFLGHFQFRLDSYFESYHILPKRKMPSLPFITFSAAETA
jgi:hypothetical protein